MIIITVQYSQKSGQTFSVYAFSFNMFHIACSYWRHQNYEGPHMEPYSKQLLIKPKHVSCLTFAFVLLSPLPESRHFVNQLHEGVILDGFLTFLKEFPGVLNTCFPLLCIPTHFQTISIGFRSCDCDHPMQHSIILACMSL